MSDYSVKPSGCSTKQFSPNCSIQVTFTPTASGNRTTKFLLGTGEYVLFFGTGQTPGPSVAISPSPLSIGATLNSYNVANGSIALNLTNNGTTTLNFSFAMSGVNVANFTFSNGTCAALAPNATCIANVSFNASSVGTYSASLALKDMNSSYSQSVPISATVVYSNVATNPEILTFGTQAVGTASTVQTFTISDQNSQPLGHPINVSSPSSNFTLPLGSTCPASTTQVCTLGVSFTPQTAASFSEHLTISDLMSGNTGILSIDGTGGTLQLSFSPTSITFPLRAVGTTSIPTPVTLTNVGTAVLSVSTVSVIGAAQANFTQTSDCSTVPVSGTCTINVTFAPSSTGPQSATIQVISTIPGPPATFIVSGTAQ